jgi:Tfp pilus assembly protein PilP
MCPFVRVADDISILEELLKNSEKIWKNKKAEIAYKPVYNL